MSKRGVSSVLRALCRADRPITLGEFQMWGVTIGGDRGLKRAELEAILAELVSEGIVIERWQTDPSRRHIEKTFATYILATKGSTNADSNRADS
jgi:hypothetical protein